jgi:hypothetical protein
MPEDTQATNDRFWDGGGGKIIGPSGQVVARVCVENLVVSEAHEVMQLLIRALCDRYPKRQTPPKK